jgi:hypothetical protein
MPVLKTSVLIPMLELVRRRANESTYPIAPKVLVRKARAFPAERTLLGAFRFAEYIGHSGQ